ncbi:MAG: GNAT family N-acetyltransferase [Candidatus Promineifilaceae bacterium]|nr:GNAT family N-acetyltransferase [Candidatus Promineifilaceae bacterium]
MVVTFPVSQANNGLRRINPNKDYPELVELLRLVFGQEAEGEGQIFGNASGDQGPSFLWRFDPQMAKLSPGFVWEKEGKIVGNVTLLPSQPAGRYLVANVAVHPNHRRQGIARLLMDAVVQDVRYRRGREILLQVVQNNQKAIGLYHSMAFENLGSMTTWRSSVSRLRELAENDSAVVVQSLPKNRWKEAYRLDCHALPPDLNWPAPRSATYYKSGVLRRIVRLFSGQNSRSFVSEDDRGQLTGLATIFSEWGRPHQIAIRIHSDWKGLLELPLLNSVVREVRYMPRRNVRITHNADDETMNQLLFDVGFRRQRTLTHMRLKLNARKIDDNGE